MSSRALRSISAAFPGTVWRRGAVRGRGAASTQPEAPLASPPTSSSCQEQSRSSGTRRDAATWSSNAPYRLGKGAGDPGSQGQPGIQHRPRTPSPRDLPHSSLPPPRTF